MSTLNAYHQSLGATLAQDNVPLHYGNLAEEYHAALNNAVLLDRSHEGRIFLTGDNRFEIVNRMSTNKIVDMPPHSGQATIFTNANARILYRVIAYNRPEGLLIITEPGQGDAIASYLQRNIFYGDKVNVINIQAQTAHFAIHGATAAQVMQSLSPDLAELSTLSSAEIEHPTATFTVLRRKPIVGTHWAILCQQQHAEAIHRHLLTIGAPHGLTPVGSLTYNTLRVRSGRPAGQELSTDYIPLEVGLWDEVSFRKGCYTGQEIIARMESRQRLAKALVKIQLSEFVEAPATVYMDNKAVGTMTSSVQAPNEEIFATAVLKTDAAHANTQLTVSDAHIHATVIDYAGEQPAFIRG
jgi:folate-binding protein YgfZ